MIEDLPTNISRIETPARGYRVKISRARAGQYHSKLFCDSRYGGRTQALTAAKRYRTKILPHYPIVNDRAAYQRTISRQSHSTGLVGISLCWRPCSELVVFATWREGKCSRSKNFYIGTPNTLTVERIVAKVNQARALRFERLGIPLSVQQQQPAFTINEARLYLKYGCVIRKGKKLRL